MGVRIEAAQDEPARTIATCIATLALFASIAAPA